jgi:hypothetical protein
VYALWKKVLSARSALVAAATFIDDAKLWCKLSAILQMQAAFEFTQQFDHVIGQRHNLSKSCCAATTKAARKALTYVFPQKSSMSPFCAAWVNPIM